MKFTPAPFGQSVLKSSSPGPSWNCHAHFRDEIARAKRTTMRDYSAEVGEHLRLLRLALNEAEALAWQTDYPHLVFPVLAAEKARATARWHRRQRALQSVAPQFSCAE